MASQIKGVIDSIRKDRKGIKINDVWYSVFAPSELAGANKGDTVSFEYTVKGDWNNVVKESFKVESSAPASSSGGGGKAAAGAQFRSVPELNRIDGLKLAVEFMASNTGDDVAVKAKIKATLTLATVFTAFIEGGYNPNGKTAAPDAAAEAAAAKAKAEEEARKKAEAEAAAAAQKAEAGSVLDDFLGSD